jgi:hypothetical protein
MLLHSCVLSLYTLSFWFPVRSLADFFCKLDGFEKSSQNGQILPRNALGSLLILAGVGYLAAQRFLRDASLWTKGFQMNIAILEIRKLQKNLIFLSTLFGASSA